MQCWNTEGVFRLIQSIPSPKAEPFKRWLARVGKERLDEIENPELAMSRMQELYEQKGYPKEWIDKRLRGIAVRQDLTDEWKDCGASSGVEFAILEHREAAILREGTEDCLSGVQAKSPIDEAYHARRTHEDPRTHDARIRNQIGSQEQGSSNAITVFSFSSASRLKRATADDCASDAGMCQPSIRWSGVAK